MRILSIAEPGPPGEVPIAGVTLLEILGEPAAVEEARLALERLRHRPPDVDVRPGDDVRRFRTPPWT